MYIIEKAGIVVQARTIVAENGYSSKITKEGMTLLDGVYKMVVIIRVDVRKDQPPCTASR